MLGLTDVKLKSELSLLVDTEIWTNAAQDIRIREKTMKQRSTEIDVEYRLRLEEIDNINTSISNIGLTIELLIAERNNKTIEFLQLQNLTVNNAIDSGTNYANIYFSSEEMSAELTRLNKNVEELQTNKLQSIQNLIMQTTREKFASTTLLRQELSSINELKSNSNMTIRRNNESKITLERKLNDVMNQRNTYNKNISVIINHINESLSLDKNNYLQLYKDSQKYSDLFQLLPFKTVHDIIDNTEIFRKVYHISVEQLASIDVKIQYNQKARNGLVDIDISINNKNSSAFSKDANTDCHEHKVTECPTCGQEMPLDIRIQREKELSADLLIYKREQQELSKFVDILKKINNYSQRLCSAQQQMSTFADREKEISIELQQIVEGTKLLTNRMLTIENDYKAKQNELTILENKFNEQEMMLNRSLLVAQAEVKSIQEEIGNIRSQLELVDTSYVPHFSLNSPFIILVETTKREHHQRSREDDKLFFSIDSGKN